MTTTKARTAKPKASATKPKPKANAAKTNAGAAKAGTPPTTQKLLDALASHPNATGAELAAAAGLGRSTVDKQLAALERAGTAARTVGEQDGRRRGASRWAFVKAQPLRPGQLNDLVLAYVQNADEPVGPVAVSRALGRSSGAVANCLDRLTRAGDLRQVADRPRRYAKS
jgi:predicted ArsR family transcriptional regulator